MNRSIVIITLFFGVLVCVNKAGANENDTSSSHASSATNRDNNSNPSPNSDILKGLEKPPENSPWDPREREDGETQAEAEE